VSETTVSASFARQLERLKAGETGLLPESEIEPVETLPDAEAFAEPGPQAAQAALAQAVVIKLNGGLGTSMGLSGPKALLPVKGELTFLDVIAEQILYLRRTHAPVPLVLMHSFATRAASLEKLAEHPAITEQDVPLDFLQSRVPKLRADDLAPVAWPDDPALEWAPPGHGDLYPSLVASGMLDALLAGGHRYAFVSNSDNLGATLDVSILAWFVASGAPFLMEAADRTAADRKGGHLARRPDGGLVLRELAMTPEADLDAFQDVDRHRYFNTNSLWLDLVQLRDVAEDGVLDLPLIVNRKTVDPRDKTSTPVIQVETAMGAAIDALPGAQAVRVPRTRMAPVKTTNDLLAVRSDAYVLTEAARIELDAVRAGRPPVISLDDHFKLVHDFDARFAGGPPSLLQCERLVVEGDVTFGADVVVRGDVHVRAPEGETLHVPDGTLLS
jgi:UTP--glucose-1-phosphate uridylyltransferase